MLLRNAHTTIVNEMGWPSWISYIIFAGTTIVMGALLGLVSAQNIIGSSPRPKSKQYLIQLIQKCYLIHYDKFYVRNGLKNLLCVIIINLGLIRDK